MTTQFSGVQLPGSPVPVDIRAIGCAGQSPVSMLGSVPCYRAKKIGIAYAESKNLCLNQEHGPTFRIIRHKLQLGKRT